MALINSQNIMKKKFFLKQIKINKEDTIKAYINNKIFTPNLTTNLLIEASKKLIMGDKKVLELGCGRDRKSVV